MNPFKKKHKTKAGHEVDYQELAKQLVLISEATNPNRFMVYRRSFMKGVVSGFGGVIGATVVVALLLYILSFFHQVPFINRFTDTIRNTVDQSQE